MARTKTSERTETAADRTPKSPAQPIIVTNDDIARRAYDLYLARDHQPGHDVDDWLQAERELRGGGRSTGA